MRLLYSIVLILTLADTVALAQLPRIVSPGEREAMKLPPPPKLASMPTDTRLNKTAKAAIIRVEVAAGFFSNAMSFDPTPVMWGILPVNWPPCERKPATQTIDISFNELSIGDLAKLSPDDLALRYRRLSWAKGQVFEADENQAILDKAIDAEVTNPDGFTSIAGKSYRFGQRVRVPAALGLLSKMGEEEGQYLVKLVYQNRYQSEGFATSENFTGLVFFMPQTEFERLRANYRGLLAALSAEDFKLSVAAEISSDTEHYKKERVREMLNQSEGKK